MEICISDWNIANTLGKKGSNEPNSTELFYFTKKQNYNWFEQTGLNIKTLEHGCLQRVYFKNVLWEQNKTILLLVPNSIVCTLKMIQT